MADKSRLNPQAERTIAGVNFYFHKHNAKATLDVLYALDPAPVNNTGVGLLRSSDDGQVVVRAQYQFRF